MVDEAETSTTALLLAIFLPIGSVLFIFALFLLKQLCERPNQDGFVAIEDQSNETATDRRCSLHTKHVIYEYLLALVDLQVLAKQIALVLLYGGSLDSLFWTLFIISAVNVVLASINDGLLKSILVLGTKTGELVVYLVVLQVKAPLAGAMYTFFIVDLLATGVGIWLLWDTTSREFISNDDAKQMSSANVVMKVLWRVLWLALTSLFSILLLFSWFFLVFGKLFVFVLANTLNILTLFLSPDSPFRNVLWFTMVQYALNYVAAFLANNSRFLGEKKKRLQTDESALPVVYSTFMSAFNTILSIVYIIAALTFANQQLQLPPDSIPSYDRAVYLTFMIILIPTTIIFTCVSLFTFRLSRKANNTAPATNTT